MHGSSRRNPNSLNRSSPAKNKSNFDDGLAQHGQGVEPGRKYRPNTTWISHGLNWLSNHISNFHISHSSIAGTLHMRKGGRWRLKKLRTLYCFPQKRFSRSCWGLGAQDLNWNTHKGGQRALCCSSRGLFSSRQCRN